MNSYIYPVRREIKNQNGQVCCTRFLNRKPSAELWPENAAPKVGRWKKRCRLFNLFWFLDAFPFPKLTFHSLPMRITDRNDSRKDGDVV